MIRVRVQQTRAQRRALATVLLIQRAYLRAQGRERREIARYMKIIARAANKIGALHVYVTVNRTEKRQ